MGWALVFSGQGLQHPGMLSWLAQDESVASIAAELGPDWRQRLANPDDMAQNRRAQILLTATACAAWSQLRPLLEPPALVAGYSVGELAAFAAAGVFDAPTAIALAGLRADGMDRAAQAEATGLLGVTQATAGGLDTLCARFDLDLAIRIDPGSGVVGGRRSDLQAAAREASSHGWRCTPLNVSLASHTRWMQSAAGDFARVLAGMPLQAPCLPLYSNALGRVRHAADAGAALARQIAQTVAWDDCMDAMAAHGVRAVLEIGPGQALAHLWQARQEGVPARSADEFRSPAAIAAWLLRHLD
jgi:[acyl-carrier-protein] S-malonyltransferase